MDRTEFKQRMKSLKSYRELSPGKGYWDWKVEAFLPGGETDNNTPMWLELPYQGPTYDLILKSLKRDDPLAYNRLLGVTVPTRDTGIVYLDNARVGQATLIPTQPTNIELRNDLSFGPLGLLPVVGDIEEIANIALDVSEGNYGQAAAGLGLLAIPGNIAGKLFKKGKKAVRTLSDETSSRAANVALPNNNLISTLLAHITERTNLLLNLLRWARNFRNRINSIPPELYTDELYEQLKQEFLNRQTTSTLINHYSQLPIANQLIETELDIFDRGFQYQTDMLEREAAAAREIRRRLANERLSNILRGLITNLPDLIRTDPYNVNNLPENFINSKGFASDIQSAIYFNMTPREAIQKATHDFDRLKHGQAWNLTHDGAVSTDSYPLQLNLMNKYKDQGMIKVFRDDNGNIETMKLNTFGRLTGNNALSRINLKLKNISDITGDKDLKATIDTEGNIIVPKILYRKYDEGGEVPPDNSPVHVNPFTGKPLANGAINNAFSLEDAANLTPLGDILSVRDAYIAAKNKDILGLGLAGISFIPFMSRIKPIDRPPIPTVNRDAWLKKLDAAIELDYRNKRTMDDFFDQRDNTYESLIENEDAFRRAAKADRSSSSAYMETYLKMIQEYNRSKARLNPNLTLPVYDPDLYDTSIKALLNPSDPMTVRLNPRYKDPDELESTFLRLNPGLVRHEMGHGVDVQAGLDYTNKLADPSKFESKERLKQMYPKAYKRILDYLLNGSEIKSHMNEFRDFLFQHGEYLSKETINTLRKKLDKYKDLFRNLNILFDAYKSKRLFVKDYNTVPITAIDRLENLV